MFTLVQMGAKHVHEAIPTKNACASHRSSSQARSPVAHPINDTGGYAIRLSTSNRTIPATPDDAAGYSARDVGSVFYVWIMPNATGSTITMVGKPTLNGAEPCSPGTPELACADFSVNPTFQSTFMSGQAEADTAHGVLSELSLEGFATGSLPAGTELIPAN